ncbi:hypothetical protein [Winogradskyella sp. PE311]|uniref:hypothetical protein n=1 Tax=Winogradskyella sp. PE311 TaxID=3366943 RepID=UPI00397F2EC4
MNKVLLLLIAILAINCKTSEKHLKMENEEPLLISKGNLFGAGAEDIKKQNLIILNQNDWNALLTKMNSINKVTDDFTETEIDFKIYRIIAVFDELKTTGGHSIELDFKTNSQNVLVKVNYKSPNGMAVSAMTQPYYIAKIPNNNLPIQFN